MKLFFIQIKYKLKKFYRDLILQKIHKFIFYKFHKIQFSKNMPFSYVDYIDLNNIIKTIKKYKPKTVLEIGSGYSTYAIIYALLNVHKNKQFKFYSLDQTLDYQKKLIDDFPKNFRDDIIFLHREINVKEFKNKKMSFFNDLPNEKFDFIYEDRKDHLDTKIAGDIIKYEHDKINDTDNFLFIIDGMISTVDYYKNNLKFKYSYDVNSFAGITFVKK